MKGRPKLSEGRAISLSAAQDEVVGEPVRRRIWLEGMAGSGKTSVGVRRVLRLIS